MLATVRLLGIPITCYPAFIICLCLVTKIIRIFLNKYSKKQSEEKAVRDEKIAQLQKEAGGDRNVLSDKIYEYYKESNYNPYLTFLSKVALIIIDFAIVAVMVTTFKPISNFHVVEKDTATTITQIYRYANKHSNACLSTFSPGTYSKIPLQSISNLNG